MKLFSPHVRTLSLVATRILFGAFLLLGTAYAAEGGKVVYHFDDTATQATKGLRNMANHLDVSPKTQIIAVAHANGIDFLLDGAKDEKNNIEYAPLISALKARGVHFEVCEITIKRRKLEKSKFVLDAEFTPSGVVRLAELQNRDNFAYIKP